MTHEISNSILLQANGLHGRMITGRSKPASLIICIHGGGCNGHYFDLPSFSFANEAVNAGHAVLTVDRPGHGLSPALDAARPVQLAAGLLPSLVTKALEALHVTWLPLAVFGHSIGGATAMHYAATLPQDLVSVVTSGIGFQPTVAALTWHDSLRAETEIQLPHEFFFGAEGSFDWRAPIAIRKSADIWLKADIDEILLDWPRRFGSVASHIAAPVLCILGEHERIWRNDEVMMAEMAQNFSSPQSRVEIAADGGHLNEVHKNWHAHANHILAFINNHIADAL